MALRLESLVGVPEYVKEFPTYVERLKPEEVHIVEQIQEKINKLEEIGSIVLSYYIAKYTVNGRSSKAAGKLGILTYLLSFIPGFKAAMDVAMLYRPIDVGYAIYDNFGDLLMAAADERHKDIFDTLIDTYTASLQPKLTLVGFLSKTAQYLPLFTLLVIGAGKLIKRRVNPFKVWKRKKEIEKKVKYLENKFFDLYNRLLNDLKNIVNEEGKEYIDGIRFVLDDLRSSLEMGIFHKLVRYGKYIIPLVISIFASFIAQEPARAFDNIISINKYVEAAIRERSNGPIYNNWKTIYEILYNNGPTIEKWAENTWELITPILASMMSYVGLEYVDGTLSERKIGKIRELVREYTKKKIKLENYLNDLGILDRDLDELISRTQ